MADEKYRLYLDGWLRGMGLPTFKPEELGAQELYHYCCGVHASNRGGKDCPMSKEQWELQFGGVD